MSQVAIAVVTEASGNIEPTLPVQTRYKVRAANGIHDVRPDVKFEMVFANFSKKPQRLPNSMTIAYAERNPLAILTVPDEVSTKLETLLNLPFTKTTANESTNDNSTNTNGREKHTKAMEWRGNIDIGHIDKNDMRTKILKILTKHEDMSTTGRLGEITATKHRITLATGTKPIRSMPYPQGPAMRKKAEIRRMHDAIVIEPATSG